MYIIHVQLFFSSAKTTVACPTLQATVVCADEKKSWTDYIHAYDYIYIYIVYIDACCNRRNRMNPAGLRCTAQACEPICVL